MERDTSRIHDDLANLYLNFRFAMHLPIGFRHPLGKRETALDRILDSLRREQCTLYTKISNLSSRSDSLEEFHRLADLYRELAESYERLRDSERSRASL